MPSIRALLAGGPYHDRIMDIDGAQATLVLSVAPPLPLLFAETRPPRPPWWKPLALARWRRLPTPAQTAIPEFKSLQYRRVEQLRDGRWLFWYSGEAAEPPTADGEVLHYLMRRLREAQRPPWSGGGHWEMGHEWYARIRQLAMLPQVNPQAGDRALGLEVKVINGAGAPRVVVPR